MDEAEKLFLRCDKLTPYQNVGRMGLGIVYALKDGPDKSIESFRKVPNNYASNLAEMNPALRYWVMEAVHYNTRNTEKEITLPVFLKNIRENMNKRSGVLKK